MLVRRTRQDDGRDRFGRADALARLGAFQAAFRRCRGLAPRPLAGGHAARPRDDRSLRRVRLRREPVGRRPAGKHNGADALSSGTRLAYLGATATAALASSLLWARGTAAPALLALGLVLALAYSARPIRLKERGIAGVAGAAVAQWTLPVLAISTAAPHGLNARSALVAVVSAALGARWMLIHQLHDAAADRRAGVHTFATKSEAAPRVLESVFAVEIAAVVGLLAVSWPGSTVPAAVLAGWIGVGELTQPLRVRLRAYDAAPLAAYYFALLPLAAGVARGTKEAVAVGAVVTILGSPALVGSLRGLLARPRTAPARA
jgi:hypothetical protein